MEREQQAIASSLSKTNGSSGGSYNIYININIRQWEQGEKEAYI